MVNTPAISSVFHHHLDAFLDAELIGLCCDDILHVPGLNEVSHRNIKLIPELRGIGLSAFMYDLSNRVGGVLDKEIAIRLTHCKLLLRAGFVPVALHFTPRPDLGSPVVAKYDLDPVAARKMILLLKSFNYENDFLDCKLRFITEFTHPKALDGTKFMDRFENVSGLSDLHFEALVQLLVDWDVIIRQSDEME